MYNKYSCAQMIDIIWILKCLKNNRVTRMKYMLEIISNNSLYLITLSRQDRTVK